MKRVLRNKVFWLFLVVMFALPVLPQPIRVPEYWVTLLNYIGLYSIVAIGLVLLTGVGGMTSFGQAAFVGIGAYTTAYLTTHFGVSPWLALIAGVMLTALIALLLGAVTMRLSGHFLPLGTIEFPQAHHLANDLRVEAVRLRFRVDFTDVSRQRGLFFLEPFDALDERFEMFFREARLGHTRPFAT